MQELFQSQAKEQQLQDQISQEQMKQMKGDYHSELSNLQAKQKSETQNYMTIIENQKAKMLAQNEEWTTREAELRKQVESLTESKTNLEALEKMNKAKVELLQNEL